MAVTTRSSNKKKSLSKSKLKPAQSKKSPVPHVVIPETSHREAHLASAQAKKSPVSKATTPKTSTSKTQSASTSPKKTQTGQNTTAKGASTAKSSSPPATTAKRGKGGSSKAAKSGAENDHVSPVEEALIRRSGRIRRKRDVNYSEDTTDNDDSPSRRLLEEAKAARRDLKKVRNVAVDGAKETGQRLAKRTYRSAVAKRGGGRSTPRSPKQCRGSNVSTSDQLAKLASLPTLVNLAVSEIVENLVDELSSPELPSPQAISKSFQDLPRTIGSKLNPFSPGTNSTKDDDDFADSSPISLPKSSPKQQERRSTSTARSKSGSRATESASRRYKSKTSGSTPIRKQYARSNRQGASAPVPLEPVRQTARRHRTASRSQSYGHSRYYDPRPPRPQISSYRLFPENRINRRGITSPQYSSICIVM